MEGNSSVPLPYGQFLWTCQSQTLCLGLTAAKLALLSWKMLLMRISLQCHLGLDGSFLPPRHDCELRYQSLALICLFRKDCPTTLLLKYLLILSSLGLSTTFFRPLMKAEGSVCRMCAGDADERTSLLLIRLNHWFSKSQKPIYTVKGKHFLNQQLAS